MAVGDATQIKIEMQLAGPSLRPAFEPFEEVPCGARGWAVGTAVGTAWVFQVNSQNYKHPFALQASHLALIEPLAFLLS